LLGCHTGLHDCCCGAAIKAEQKGSRDDHGCPKDGVPVQNPRHLETGAVNRKLIDCAEFIHG
jgi:hypothetical protein